jgi:hypothetical protein
MPKMRNARPLRAARGDICASRARQLAVSGLFSAREPAKRAAYAAHSHALTWINVTPTQSIVCEHFAAKSSILNTRLSQNYDSSRKTPHVKCSIHRGAMVTTL